MSAEQRPNILFIMTDQMRGDFMRCAGHPLIQTPHLDQIADEGVLFEGAYSECPVCIPARYSLMSGRLPEHIDLLRNRGIEMPIKETLPYMLSQAGYQTQSVGKLHFTPQRACYGFENTIVCEAGRMRDGDDYHRWLQGTPYAGQERMHGIGNNMVTSRPSLVPESHHVTTWTVSQSLDFLDRRDPTRPFFLYTSFTKPHSPYDPPAPWDSLYDPAKLDEPLAFDLGSETMSQTVGMLPDVYGWNRLSLDEVKQIRARYMGEISHIDAQIGRLLGGLAWRGLLDNTMVVFCSDHGDMIGDRGLFFKTLFYEGSMRIPMIISLPRNQDRVVGRRVSTPVGLVDLLPTILDFAGVEDSIVRDGRSLLGFAKGETPFDERIIHSVYGEREGDLRHCVTDGTWKFIWNRTGGFEELYRPKDDPEERMNLAPVSAYALELERWRKVLVETLAAEGASYCLCDDRLAPIEMSLPSLDDIRSRDQFGRRDF